MQASTIVNHAGSFCRSTPALLCAAFLALAWGSGSAAAQSQKVNGSMLRPYEGEVENVQLSPDGAWVIYRAYSETGGFASFSVPSKGGTPIPIDLDFPGWVIPVAISPDSRFVVSANGPLWRVPIDGSRGATQLAPDAFDFRFSSDGTRVVYVGYIGGRSLFSVALDGTEAPVRLTEPAAGATIESLEIGRGDRSRPERVVYRADAETDGVIELYSVPLDGSAEPVKLNMPFAPFSDVGSFAIAPSGERVVFLADPLVNESRRLFSAPIDGSAAPVDIGATRVQDSSHVRISPDSRRVVFLAQPASPDVFELLSVPVDGSLDPVRLNRQLPAGGDVGSFEIAPSSDRVVYVADQDVNDVLELFSVPIDGSAAALEIDHALEPGEDVYSFQLAGQRVVYRALLYPQTSSSLYSVPLLGGEDPVLLSGERSAYSFLVAPDGARVAFVGLEPHFVSRGLFSVPVAGGSEPVVLDAGGRGLIAITADGEHAVYEADLDVEGLSDLFSVPLAGDRSGVPLNHPMAALAVADVVGFRVAPEGDRCLFVVGRETCDCDDSGSSELHVAGIDPISPTTLIAENVGMPRFSPDGAWMVFQAPMGDGEDFARLYSAAVGGAVEPLELDRAAAEFAITLDGGSVVFAKGLSMGGVYRRPIDGSAPATPLALGTVESLVLSPDGTRVVYAQEIDDAFRLFSVPTDGSGPAVPLHDVSYPRGSPRYGFGITPDGERVFYATDQEVDGVDELFSVPIAGGADPIKLSGNLVLGGDVARFSVRSAGGRLVYHADALVDGVFELFTTPVDGSAAPARLNGTLPAGGSVREFAFAAGGARVVYHADQLADELFELFSAPIDAATSAVRLNAPLVAGGDVFRFNSGPSFALSPDGTNVVYVADQASDEVYELYATAVDGGGIPRRLGNRLVAGGDVQTSFFFTPDGTKVVYLADGDRDEVVELFEAPIEGGKGQKLNGPLVVNGDVAGISPAGISADGRWLLYTADQDTDTVQELYRVDLRAAPGSGPLLESAMRTRGAGSSVKRGE